jgi:hypothetical protein
LEQRDDANHQHNRRRDRKRRRDADRLTGNRLARLIAGGVETAGVTIAALDLRGRAERFARVGLRRRAAPATDGGRRADWRRVADGERRRIAGARLDARRTLRHAHANRGGVAAGRGRERRRRVAGGCRRCDGRRRHCRRAGGAAGRVDVHLRVGLWLHELGSERIAVGVGRHLTRRVRTRHLDCRCRHTRTYSNLDCDDATIVRVYIVKQQPQYRLALIVGERHLNLRKRLTAGRSDRERSGGVTGRQRRRRRAGDGRRRGSGRRRAVATRDADRCAASTALYLLARTAAGAELLLLLGARAKVGRRRRIGAVAQRLTIVADFELAWHAAARLRRVSFVAGARASRTGTTYASGRDRWRLQCVGG